MSKVKGLMCAPCVDISIRKFDSSLYGEIAASDGRAMTEIIRVATKAICDKYPVDIDLSNHKIVPHMYLRGLGKSGHKIRQICAQLGVSVSDFMKIELYNELVLKKSIDTLNNIAANDYPKKKIA